MLLIGTPRIPESVDMFVVKVDSLKIDAGKSVAFPLPKSESLNSTVSRSISLPPFRTLIAPV